VLADHGYPLAAADSRAAGREPGLFEKAGEKGGVLGMGKSATLSGAVREGDFTALDTDRATEISITGKEPQVLSAQSKSSYEISIAPGTSVLRITDVAEFRKVKYLVVLIK
jgi:hypothetical protein